MSGTKILIITYYWPPSGGVGVQRWMHFARNLKERGWEPIIYTPENPQFEVKDEALLEVVKGIQVIQSPIWEPFSIFHKITGNKERGNVQQGLVLEKSKKSWKDQLIVWIRGNLFVPDPRMFWVRSSVRKLNDVVQTAGIQYMVTTGPPHSIHLIGLGVKGKNPAINWFADFRDPWSDWDILPKLNTGRLAMRRHRMLEKQVLQRATRVLTVSKRLQSLFQEKLMDPDKIILLPNGLDIKSLPAVMNQDKPQDKFVVGYFGMLNELRDPTEFWSCLEALCDADPLFASRLEIRLGGIVSAAIQERLLSSPQLGPAVKLLGYLAHQEIFEAYQNCSVLLLLLNKSENAKWILPVKFFEYLSAYRPVLGLGPVVSDLGDLFQNRQIGEMLDPENREAISNFLLANFKEQYPINKQHFDELLNEFSRELQADRLVTLLENL